ncbi:efflux RND transporter periplasmic adaptor subunit [Verminephrobacter aporrectodeae subsp. tuberculatae]|uniref:efflux RND transporter periplasmic adaptor subunit n=1 Tax=Verminephrobacter aporrectodeae TaxID=1110389 RepID=UPI002238DB7B|nr:efflux RND transporter periplasmic adaptor subunit [Verminephrobacter aporrectodeae]MCW5254974.1 efflux RND transporter periplasmic adaptor subunit [Verminephrobacter aporrectodeae subsp. tuberculatae]
MRHALGLKSENTHTAMMNPQEVSTPPPTASSASSALSTLPAPLPPPAAAPPARRLRWVGSLVALLLAGLLGVAAWYLVGRVQGGRGQDSGHGQPLVTVGEATVTRAQLPVLIDALGTVLAASTVTLRPQVSGMLTQVLFTEGQMVRKGQLLAQIDPRPFEQALMQVRGTRQRDEAQLELARLTLERYRTLLAQDSIARQEVDGQAALVRQLEGTVLSDQAQEGTARLNLEFTRITAPAGGRIGLRTVDAGNPVGPGDAAGIATITGVAPIDVRFAVPQDRVGEIRAAQRGAAALTVTALDRARQTELGTGRFSTLDNLVDTTTGTVKAKAHFENAAGALFPNQFVNVQLLLRHVSALVVPVTAVRTGAQGDYVYVIGADRRVSLRQVRRGQASAEQVAITEGLAQGERVVTEGGDRLQDGMLVQLPGARGGAQGARTGDGARRQRPSPKP